MKYWRDVVAVVAMTAALISCRTTRSDDDFRAFLDRMDVAQRELQDGRAESYKALWEESDSVTLSGGFGGAIEKGWPAVGRRLEWAASQFSGGNSTIERLAASSNGDLGYVVQREHIRFRAPGRSDESTRDYRVTMVFRRGPDGWRIVHRHADPQTVKTPAGSS